MCKPSNKFKPFQFGKKFKKNLLCQRHGLSLVAAIMLLVFVSIAVLGISTFIYQRLIQNETKTISSRCLYLAQAGIHRAIYDFRFRDIAANGYFTLGQTNIDANNNFTLTASQADLLMVNTSTATLTPNSGANQFRDLVNLSMQNATNSQTIAIDRMVISWVKPPPARTLARIRINGDVWWNAGGYASPANANLCLPASQACPAPRDNFFDLNTTPTIYSINEIRFSGSMAGATITIQFIMQDGSTRTLNVYPASNNNIFTVQSTGRTTGSNIYRRIRADYNTLGPPSPRIIDLDEIQ